MLIVTQDKDEVVNFDCMEEIYIKPSGESENSACWVSAMGTSGETVGLGRYASVGRAKEVIQDFLTEYALKRRMYQMPKA